jgi:chaperonin GroES
MSATHTVYDIASGEPVPAVLALNRSGIEPLDVKVVVKPLPVEQKTAGGIILADSTKEQAKYATTRGTLLAAGPNAFREWGLANAPPVGCVVLYAQYAGSRFKADDGEEYWVMNDEDVIGRAAQ